MHQNSLDGEVLVLLHDLPSSGVATKSMEVNTPIRKVLGILSENLMLCRTFFPPRIMTLVF